MTLSLRHSTVLKIALIVFVGTLEVVFVTIPSIQTIHKTRWDIQDQVYHANLLLEKGKTINRLREYIEKITPFLERFNEIFIRPEDQLTFIVSLEELAKRHNITAQLSLNDLPKSSISDFVNVPLNMRIEGTFPELVRFLMELQKLNYYINIKTITLERGSGGDGTSIASDLRSLTYWQPKAQ